MQHVWSVFCTRSVIDGDSNNITLVEVLEQFQIVSQVPLPTPGVMPLPSELVTLWSRDDIATAEQGTARLRLIAPDGHTELHSVTYTVDLGPHPRLRSRTRLNGLPVAGEGLHNFEVSFRVAPDDDWVVKARVPVHITLLVQPVEGNVAAH